MPYTSNATHWNSSRESTCHFLVNVLLSSVAPPPPPPSPASVFLSLLMSAAAPTSSSPSSCVLVPSPVFFPSQIPSVFASPGRSASWPSPHVLHLALVYLPGVSPAEHCVCACLIVPVTLCVFVRAGVSRVSPPCFPKFTLIETVLRVPPCRRLFLLHGFG